MSEPLIELKQLRFRWGPSYPWILDIPQLSVATGERLFIRGPSGCGKSTLLGLLTGIHSANEGQVRVLGQSLAELSGPQRDRFRAEHIGYLFQQFNLLPYLSVIDNVCLSLSYAKQRRQRAAEAGGIEAEARRLLLELGLSAELLERPVTELSIGQQQRVGAARALIGQPELVIADEPTSALDTDSRDRFIDLLLHECQTRQQTLVFVSHDPSLGHHFHRQLELPELNRGGAQ